MFLTMEGTRQLEIISVKILRECIYIGSYYSFKEVKATGAAFE